MFKEIIRYILRGGGAAVKIQPSAGVAVHDSLATLPDDGAPSPIRRESITDLAKFYQSVQSYTGLVLSSQNIDDSKIQIIFRSISGNASLKHLDLSRNFITEAGVEGMSSFLFVHALRTIKISNNAIGDKGVLELASILRSSNALTHLSLDENGVSPSGARELADALKVNTSLKYLSMDSNRIGDDGVSALADSLRVNSTLQFLRCDSNEISDVGAINLAIVLHRDGMALEYLSLNNNEIKDSGAEQFFEGLNRYCTLKVHLRGNYIAVEVEGRLKDEFGGRVNLLDQKISSEEMGFWNKTILPGTQNMNLEGEVRQVWESGNELQEEGASTNGRDQGWEMQDVGLLGA